MGRRIAFYAPLKPPGHPIPSGDREVARNLLKALALAGYDATVASEAISYQKRPSPDLFRQRRATCQAEAQRLISAYETNPATAPELWMTYHPYCKAPDWIGPPVVAALAIPYVTVEACRTRQNEDADWAGARAAVQAAVAQAGANFCLKPSDRDYLATFLPDMQRVVALPPFLDEAEIRQQGAEGQAGPAVIHPHGSAVILAVGMMRPGAKIESYRLLAAAMADLPANGWNLVVIGDGPARPDVEAMFAFAGERVHFLGALPREKVLAWMKTADIFAWPGVREAFGMVYLEAQASGLPVAAFATAGVPIVVADGVTGLLAPEGDVAALSAIIARLVGATAERRAMGEAGRRNVAAHHGLAAAARTLKEGLDPLLRETGP